MSDLELYRKKRRFGVTTEPEGSAPRETPDEPAFVVQKHAARRLHYDFRLEIGGTLKSWAVPEGPCLDPKVRRLAVHVEDHPLDYGNFEGRIPSGEYGAGAVIVWDRGHWLPDPPRSDPSGSLEDGELTFVVLGERLRGGFVFVRTRGMGGRDDRDMWLLIHRRDDEAIDGWSIDAEPTSVLSGRTNEEVAAGVDRRRRRGRHEEAALRRESAASR